MTRSRYRDRSDAGRHLAEALSDFAEGSVYVLGLPRGGVPVAFEVAAALHAPLDVYIVRKLGVPGHEELAMGAVAGDGTVIADEELIAALGVSREEFEGTVRRERAPAAARRTCERLGNVADRVVCLLTPDPFYAVGLCYEDFAQTSDDDVRAILRRAAQMEANRWRVA
jgi:putative phosphoribosyl transferase